MEPIEIGLDSGEELSFTGKYRRDLETDNWHYWECDRCGEKRILHIRKDRIVWVESSSEPVKDKI